MRCSYWNIHTVLTLRLSLGTPVTSANYGLRGWISRITVLVFKGGTCLFGYLGLCQVRLIVIFYAASGFNFSDFTQNSRLSSEFFVF